MELRDYGIAGAECLTARKRSVNTEIKRRCAHVKLGKIIARAEKNTYFCDLQHVTKKIYNSLRMLILQRGKKRIVFYSRDIKQYMNCYCNMIVRFIIV